MDSPKLISVFDEFWAKIPKKPFFDVDRDCMYKTIKVNGVLKPEDDISCGMHDISVTKGVTQSYKDDPDLLQADSCAYYCQHPRLLPCETVSVEKIRFLICPYNFYDEAEVYFTIWETVPSTGVVRKRSKGILFLSKLEKGKDATKFFRIAKDSLAARKRPVIVDCDLDGLD